MIRRVGGALGLSVAALCPADALADRADALADPARFARVDTPLVVIQRGPDTIRVRISAGRTLPCDSSSNRMVIDRRVASGEVVRATAISHCVCFQQTYAPLAESSWSTAERICSPCAYDPHQRAWVCPPGRDPTIAIEVRSSRVTGSR